MPDVKIIPVCLDFHQMDDSIVSYVPKRRKALIRLSSQHRDVSVDDGEQKKPEIIHNYNKTRAALMHLTNSFTHIHASK